MTRKLLVGSLVAVLLGWSATLACAATSNETQATNEKGGNGGSSAGGGKGGTASGGGGVSTGGVSSGGGGSSSDAACQGISQQTENKVAPSDIVIAIDQSSSMTAETQFVQQQINGLATQLTQSGIDVHLVLIAERPSGVDSQTLSQVPSCDAEESNIENPICIPPPLAGASCGDNSPTYQSVNCHVDSHDAFDLILATYNLYKPTLRPDSNKHVVVITDDSPGNIDSATFDSQLKSKDPSFQKYFFHAIVPFTDCSYAAGSADDYRSLVQQTTGVEGDLCTQNFQPVWTALAQAVVQNTKLSCEWTIPPPPAGEQFDPTLVNVVYTTGGVVRPLGYVTSAAECAQFKDAWYYDNPSAPTKVIVCPDLCTEIQGVGIGTTQQMDIVFGCKSDTPIPK